MAKPIDSLKAISRYIEAKKPKTLTEAEHMLDLISVIADETVGETEAELSLGLSPEALASFDERTTLLPETIKRI
jgi:hypothetical protein